MGDIIELKEVEEKIIIIREKSVILDSDVAELYGVETKVINQAVKNNAEKFPSGYIFILDDEEKSELVENFDRFHTLKHSTVLPHAFTEKGLYMLATILKSKKATETTIAIVETFTKMRELARAINQLPEVADESKQKSLAQKTGELFAEVLDDNALEVSGDETTIEVNLAVMKFAYTVRRDKKV